MAYETYNPEMVRDIHSQIQTVNGEARLPTEFCDRWSDTRATLIALKKITPDSVDRLIDEIIEAGDRACANS